jgi:hypothetical protein
VESTPLERDFSTRRDAEHLVVLVQAPEHEVIFTNFTGSPMSASVQYIRKLSAVGGSA